MEVKDSHKRIYENEKVNRWYMNNRQGSPISADIRRRNLALYCDIMHTTPEAILKQAKEKRLEENFERFRDLMLSKGKRGA